MVKLNKNECKWFVILLGFTYLLYRLLSTGKIYYFIHPRMIKYIKFSLVIFFILGIVQLKNIFKLDSPHSKRKISLCIFLLPLILGLYFNPQQLNGEVASKKGVNILHNDIKKNTVDISQGSNLEVDTNNFTKITDDIGSNNPNKYKGRTITITGFIYKDDASFSNNEFVISRLMLTCCAADAEVVGLLCEWDNTSTLKNDEWIKVTGIIDSKDHKYEGKDQIIPFIKVQKVEPIQKPENQYVYPK